MNETLFKIKGGFDISKKNKPLLAANGDVIGYTLPDGRIVRLVVALEIENFDNTFKYVVNQDAMETLGFENLDYSELTFYPK